MLLTKVEIPNRGIRWRVGAWRCAPRKPRQATRATRHRAPTHAPFETCSGATKQNPTLTMQFRKELCFARCRRKRTTSRSQGDWPL
jgi:hypothetical protein